MGITGSSVPQTINVGEEIFFSLVMIDSEFFNPNKVDIKANFALCNFILLTNPVIVALGISLPDPSIVSNAFFALCSLGYNAAIMYASRAKVDCFIIPDGDTKISFSTEFGLADVNSAAICPPNDEPIMLVFLIPKDFRNFSKKFEKKPIV